MLSKTYKSIDDDWASDHDKYEPKPKVSKKKRRMPSLKEVLDQLEEHNDGYIPTQVDDVDRGE